MTDAAIPTRPRFRPGPALTALVGAGFALALLGCFLPWVAHPAAALAPNLIDLAEWTSLHPAVRAMSPPLLLTFGLRAVLALVGVGFALTTRWGWAVGALVVLRLLPPLDFFRGGGGDPNFQQQFALAVGTAVLVAVAAVGWPAAARRLRWWTLAPVVPAALGAAVAVWGAVSALVYVTAMYAAGYGVGVGVTVAGCLLGVVGSVGRWLNTRRRAPASAG
jgi:hypothetical protein